MYVKKLQNYKVTVNDIFVTRQHDEKESINFFNLDESEEKEFLTYFETNSYYSIDSAEPITGCDLAIFIENSLKMKDWLWYYSGVFFGIIVVVINLFLIKTHLHGSISQIASISTIAITYLVVTKGWVFMKDIDDVVTLGGARNIPFLSKIPFSPIYLVLIFAIFLELCYSVYFGYIDPINGIVNSTILGQDIYQNAYMAGR